MNTIRGRLWTVVLSVLGGFLLSVLILLGIVGGGSLIIPLAVLLIPFMLLFVIAQDRHEPESKTDANSRVIPDRDYKEEAEIVASNKSGQLPRTVLSGFIASMAMLITFAIAYVIAGMIAGDVATGTSSKAAMGLWLFNLTHNRVLDMAQSLLYLSIGAHFAMGLLLAVFYTYIVEPRMWGPGWVRGALFAAIPWLFSVAVFFPLVGGGFLGMNLGAGPLPFLGNLILHVVYGATLGLMYEPMFDELPDVDSRNEENTWAMVISEEMAAKGMLIGLVGGLMGGVLLGITLQPRFQSLSISVESATLMMMLIGGASGVLLGSFFGLPTRNRRFTR